MWLWTVGAFAFASCAFGTTVTMVLTSPGGNILGGVYVAPYYASINGGASIPVICDDFLDESWVGPPSWSANVTTAGSLNGELNPLTTLLFDKSSASQQQTDYAEAAYLAEQLMAPGTVCPQTANCLGDIQFAIWNIFDPSTKSGSVYTSGPLSLLSGNDLSNAVYWQSQAAANAGSVGNYSNVLIYSPVGGSGPPQEFLYVDGPPPVNAPEASTAAILGLDMFGLIGLVALLRRSRKLQSVR